jgi:hypothetical protein
VARRRISLAGVNRIANRYFIVKAACRNSHDPESRTSGKSGAPAPKAFGTSTSSRNGRTRVLNNHTANHFLDFETSCHRDHNLETGLGKISFNLFSNRLRVPCSANIQVLAVRLFVIEFRCAHTHLPRARQTRKHCQTGCRRSHIRWEFGSFACAPNLRVHDQDHTDSLGVGENQSRRDSVKVVPVRSAGSTPAGCAILCHVRSTQRAIPIPPPIQRVATPRCRSLRSISCRRVTRIRAPDAPIG